MTRTNDLNAWVSKETICTVVTGVNTSVGEKERRRVPLTRKKKAKSLHSMKCCGNSPVVPIFNNLNEYHLKHHTD